MGPRTYIIAEAGVNHNGSELTARKMIDCAAECGADAIKFQTFTADKLVAKSAPMAEYQKAGATGKSSQWEMLASLELSHQAHLDLAAYAESRGIDFLSTPFDPDSLSFLVDDVRVKYIKIASGEVTNAPLLLQAARTGLPIILSTGMCTIGEIEDALGVLAYGYLFEGQPPSSSHWYKQVFARPEAQPILRDKVIVLHCTSQYPTPYENVNLRAMQTIASTFGVQVGLSDHTLGTAISVAAVALGASVIEKHFTLDTAMPGPDHRMSLQPQELKALVDGIRQVELALGSSRKAPTEDELPVRAMVRKGLIATADIAEGESFNEHNIAIKRPEGPVSPFQYWQMIGQRASRHYRKDEAIAPLPLSPV